MLSHRQIWSAIDALAARYSMSVSGLARRAGLDPTTFNKSKRAAGDGRLRWPNTESISKILEATGCSIEEFMSLVSNPASDYTTYRHKAVPLIGFAQAGGLDLAHCLATGCAVSGAYVRDALSPDLDRLIGFLRDLPAPD